MFYSTWSYLYLNYADEAARWQKWKERSPFSGYWGTDSFLPIWLQYIFNCFFAFCLLRRKLIDATCCLWLQVFEVAPSLHMVELRKTGGDTLEFNKVCENYSDSQFITFLAVWHCSFSVLVMLVGMKLNFFHWFKCSFTKYFHQDWKT